MKKIYYILISLILIVATLAWQNMAWADIVTVDSYSETNLAAARLPFPAPQFLFQVVKPLSITAL